MKKLTLTFCALIALVAVVPALFADDGPESSGKKEVMQPAPPVCDLYRAHEWDLSIWAAYAFASDTGHFDVPNNDPFDHAGPTGGDVDIVEVIDNTNAGTITTIENPLYNPNERLNIGRWSKNGLFGRDDTFGGGADAKYFWSKYFGIGVEGLGLASKTNFAGAGLGTLTFRYPFGRFSPYVFGGLGVLDGGATIYKFFNEKPTQPNKEEFWTYDPVSDHYIRGIGQLGIGLEYRVTCHIGLMADFSWNFVFGSSSDDKIGTQAEQGQAMFIVQTNGQVVSSTPYGPVIVNTANYLKPGRDPSDQDFGLVRFGVTFSY